MSGYLQRLLDTAATGEAMRPSALAPVVKSTSPVFEQNQLLALGDVAFGTAPWPRPEPLVPTPSPAAPRSRRPGGGPAAWPTTEPDVASAPGGGLVDPALAMSPRIGDGRVGAETSPTPAPRPGTAEEPATAAKPRSVVSGEPGAETAAPRRAAPSRPAGRASAAARERWTTVAPPPSQSRRLDPSEDAAVAAGEAPASTLADVERPSRPGAMPRAAAAERRSPPTRTPHPDLPVNVEPRVRPTPDAERVTEAVAIGLEPRSRPRPAEMTPRPPRDDGRGRIGARTETVHGAAQNPRITIGRMTIEVVPDAKPAASPPTRPLTAETVSLIGPLGRPRTARRLLALRRL